MIIEFSAPPGSGKSAIAKAISHEGYKLFRFSTLGEGGKLNYFTWAVSPVFICAFINIFFYFLYFYKDLSLKRKVVSALVAAQTKVLKRKKAWYVRDQGYFQLGDWVPGHELKNSGELVRALEKIGGMPEAVVFFDIPPEVVCEKLDRRGDLGKWIKKAKQRGYDSILERLEEQRNLDEVKYEMCRRGGVPFAVVSVDEGEGISAVDYYFPREVSDSRKKDIGLIVESIKRNWLPYA